MNNKRIIVKDRPRYKHLKAIIDGPSGIFRAWRWSLMSTIRRYIPDKCLPKPVLHAVGDSHAKGTFRRVAGFQAHHLGPVTMNRIARDGRGALRLSDLGVYDRDIVIWCLGEVDVRCHIIGQAQKQGLTVTSITTRLAEKYLLSIADIQRDAHDIRTIILAVIPPINQGFNPDRPKVGSLEERINARRLLNQALKEKCSAFGFHYLNPYDAFTEPTGALKASMSDGSIHVGRSFAGLIVEQVEKYVLQHIINTDA